jgi:c-di-GMP-binding flagellar brake protein YcgR
MDDYQDHQSQIGGSVERRESSRFPLQQEVQYRVLNSRAEKISGVGRTLDMSSSGILFSTEQRLHLGRLVEVAVNWPAWLDGKCPLKFVAVGRVVRSEPFSAALKIERYEFRTRARTAVAVTTGVM